MLQTDVFTEGTCPSMNKESPQNKCVSIFIGCHIPLAYRYRYGFQQFCWEKSNCQKCKKYMDYTDHDGRVYKVTTWHGDKNGQNCYVESSTVTLQKFAFNSITNKM